MRRRKTERKRQGDKAGFAGRCHRGQKKASGISGNHSLVKFKGDFDFNEELSPQNLNRKLADREFIDIRIELYKADGTLVQTRIGNVYNFVSRADSRYTVPEDGTCCFRLVNETPGNRWDVHYKVTDHSGFWNKNAY